MQAANHEDFSVLNSSLSWLNTIQFRKFDTFNPFVGCIALREKEGGSLKTKVAPKRLIWTQKVHLTPACHLLRGAPGRAAPRVWDTLPVGARRGGAGRGVAGRGAACTRCRAGRPAQTCGTPNERPIRNGYSSIWLLNSAQPK